MDAFLGTIMPWPVAYPPRGWAFCNGTLLNVQTNQALFALLGTRYGGDGTTNFALPNLNGRVVMGAGTTTTTALAAFTNNQPSTATASVKLDIVNLPPHTHPAAVVLGAATTTIKVGTAQTGGEKVASNNAVLTGAPDTSDISAASIYLPISVTPGGTVNLGAVTTTVTTGTATLTVDSNVSKNTAVTVNTALQVTPPYQAFNFIICTSGIFPTRN